MPVRPAALAFSAAVALLAPLCAGASPSLAGCYVVQPQKWGVAGPEGGKRSMVVQPARPGEFEVVFSGEGGRQSFPVRSARPGELARVGIPSTRPITEGLVMEGPPVQGEGDIVAPPQPMMLKVFADRGRPVLLVMLPVTGYAQKVSCPPRS